MPQRRVAVASAEGLHARPAALFVKAATDSGEAVRVAKAGSEVDARSILAVLALDVRHGDEVVLTADTEKTLDALAALLGPSPMDEPSAFPNDEAS
jgi:phosphocarrier protein